MTTGAKLFSDPVHGFISVPRGLPLALVQTPEVQRLRRIRQLGVGFLVFPGAEHSRFGHALGAMALMQDALHELALRGTPISADEHTAALAAALLHDVGHGPFSHTLERELIEDFWHEDMSRAFMAEIDARMDGALGLALQIFDDTYERPFFHQLVSSQLDMDRLDYLRRDSFYTGVVEGRVGVERIIKTLRVHPIEGGPGSRIVVEAKGTYAAENFIVARRLMYWQVYLHKTVLAGDGVLRSILRRVRHLLAHRPADVERSCAPDFFFFLRQRLTGADLARPEVVDAYRRLDDTDLLYSIKRWTESDDRVLADLARRFLNRDFFRVAFLEEAPAPERLEAWRARVAEWLVEQGISERASAQEDAALYVTTDTSRHAAYASELDSIQVLARDGSLHELSRTADAAALGALTGSVEKPYVSFPKGLGLDVRTLHA